MSWLSGAIVDKTQRLSYIALYWVVSVISLVRCPQNFQPIKYTVTAHVECMQLDNLVVKSYRKLEHFTATLFICCLHFIYTVGSRLTTIFFEDFMLRLTTNVSLNDDSYIEKFKKLGKIKKQAKKKSPLAKNFPT